MLFISLLLLFLFLVQQAKTSPYYSKKKKAFECWFGRRLLWQQLKFRDIKVRPVKTIFEKVAGFDVEKHQKNWALCGTYWKEKGKRARKEEKRGRKQEMKLRGRKTGSKRGAVSKKERRKRKKGGRDGHGEVDWDGERRRGRARERR